MLQFIQLIPHGGYITMNESKPTALPFLLTFFVVIADQVTKFFAAKIPYGTTAFSYFDGFIQITHQRNKGAAFSFGLGTPEPFWTFLFIVIPLIFLLMVVIYYFRDRKIALLQRWAFAGIVGGGVGNIIDRIIHDQGVIDFIKVRTYTAGTFLNEFIPDPWPVFNVADSSIVVCTLLLVVTILFYSPRQEPQEPSSE